MKKRIKLIIKILAIILVLGVVIYLLWHYRFLYRETVHLSYNADEITEIRIVAHSTHYSEPRYNENGEIEGVRKRYYYLNTESEIKEFIKELNSIDLKKMDYNDWYMVDELIRDKSRIVATLYNNDAKLNVDIHIFDKYICITEENHDAPEAEYIVAKDFYKPNTIPPFEDYFIEY